MRPRLIALLTDFGEDDFFVASLKAVILSVNPQAGIVDIGHRIPSFDIDAAAFVLFAAYRYFPAGTIFLVVVDPGVGSKRRIVLVRTGRYFFIAPDNGVLSLVLGEETILGVRQITNRGVFLPHPSKTFEARDKMAPAAAWLSRGKAFETFGPAVRDLKKKEAAWARLADGEIRGRVLHVDKFGNLITNIPAALAGRLAEQKGRENLRLYLGGKTYGGFRENYSQADKGEVFFLAGSAGLIEVSARRASAARKSGARRNEVVRIAPARRKSVNVAEDKRRGKL
jgi:S-adenosylmethionine hydrolase